MKRYVLFALVAVLSTFTPRSQCKAIASSKDEHTGSRLTERQRPVLPILMQLGEDYFIRLDDPKQSLNKASEHSSLPRAATVNRALQLQLTQRLLQEEVDELGNVLTDSFIQLADSAERKRRGDEPPISLDLTFHLLREVLEMARAEQLAQQASSNRKMMDFFGK
ncbi:corticoliberin [Pangasianodon hypophthalmus]|uniref:corticoliberin n=1 Tax=Pangasianodon hypophthalmus TaxID=310915 RepID=UPI00147D7434|nr:corticoliberin [Pangasianodon hypophthalmus]